MDYRRLLLLLLPLAACVADPEEVVENDENAELAGVYNVVDVNDNTNLELREDGTFRTLSIGCDFEGGSSGLWSVEDGDIVLRPGPATPMNWREGACPSECFSWSYIGPEGEGLGSMSEELRLVPQGDGEWSAMFYDLTQEWEIEGQRVSEGGVCMTCGVGPAPCEDPFTHDPYAG